MEETKEEKKAKAEKYVLNNVSITNLIKRDFLEKLNKIDKDTFPISLIFIKDTGEGKDKKLVPLTITHQSSEEVKKGILHIESLDTDLAKTVTEVLENLK